MFRKLLVTTSAFAVAVASIPMFAAFEAHVINVTATIENALKVDTSAIDYGTVFPQEKLDKPFTVSLSDSFVASQGVGPNLIQNFGFESPAVTTSQGWNIFPDGTPGLVWTVEWVNPAAVFGNQPAPQPALQELHKGLVLGWNPHEGNQYTELDSDWDGPNGSLNGEPALVKIHQNIATVPGSQYRLSYWASPRPGQGSGQNVMQVKIDNGLVRTVNAGAGGANTAWVNYVDNFTATGATTKVEFVGGGTNDSLGIFLDDISLTSVGKDVSYVLRQKPKCVDASGAHPQVTEDADGVFHCPDGSVMMPLLCPYLSKHETTSDGVVADNDSAGITAFHGLPGPWTLQTTINTQVRGNLSITGQDTTDTWNIDLKVPCFTGMCAQDWATFVHDNNPDADPVAYMADPLLEHEIFGCDLWLEVTGFGPTTTEPELISG